MEISNKKLKKALEYYEKGKYKEALKVCNKVLTKEYNNEEALTLEGEILFKAGKLDDAIVTWKINAEYNNNQAAKDHLARVDKETKANALCYTSIINVEEVRKALSEAEAEKRAASKKVIDLSSVKNEKTIVKEKAKEARLKEAEEKAKLKEEQRAKEAKLKEEEMAKKTARLKEEQQAKEAKLKEEQQAKEARLKEETAKEIAKIQEEEMAKKMAKLQEEEMAKEAKLKEEAIAKNPITEKTNDSKVVEETSNEPEVTIIDRNQEEKPKKEAKPEYDKIFTASAQNVSSKNGFNKKIIAIIVAGVIVIGGGIAIGTHAKSKDNSTKTTEITKPKVDWTGFNQNMEKALQENNYNQIYSLLSIAPFNEVPKANLGPYESALATMGTSGIEYFYNTGMQDYKNKNYAAAIENFKKGLAYSVGNYLEPHLIYFTGASYSGLGDHTEAVKYYKEYLQKFPNADIYNSGCLYILAKYYYSIGDKTQAVQYAKELTSKFPNSPYNNNDIANILNGK